MASCFSRPSTRYFSRQSLPPAGVTNRNMPLPSANLAGLAPGLALRIATSVRGIRYQPLRGTTPSEFPQGRGYRVGRFANTPQSYPHRLVAECEQRWTLAASYPLNT